MRTRDLLAWTVVVVSVAFVRLRVRDLEEGELEGFFRQDCDPSVRTAAVCLVALGLAILALVMFVKKAARMTSGDRVLVEPFALFLVGQVWIPSLVAYLWGWTLPVAVQNLMGVAMAASWFFIDRSAEWRTRMAQIGLCRVKRAWHELVWGGVACLVIIGLLALLFEALVPFVASPQVANAAFPVPAYVLILASIVEELALRGMFYSALRARLDVPLASLGCGLVFAALHEVPGELLAPYILVGVVLSLLREWRGAIYAPCTSHVCFNILAALS